MLSRSFRSQDQTRIDKSARLKKHRDPKASKRSFKADRGRQPRVHAHAPPAAPAPSPIVTLAFGREARLFAAHEDVLRQAPFFDAALRGAPSPDPRGTRVSLPDEEPEVFSAVLEYLYKGDYYPRLVRDSARDAWELEDASPYSPAPGRSPASVSSRPASDATVRLSTDDEVLRDTAIYCAADRYGLEDLKLLALRKQGLQSGIDVATILRSAAYAYAHTPDSDSRLRAHYLALIIRCRRTFKRSGTMQVAMEEGGSKLFFDLFVAMCNHLDDVMDAGGHSPRPRA